VTCGYYSPHLPYLSDSLARGLQCGTNWIHDPFHADPQPHTAASSLPPSWAGFPS